MNSFASVLCILAALASASAQLIRSPPPPVLRKPPPPAIVRPNCTYLIGGATSISYATFASSPLASQNSTAGYAVSLMSQFVTNATVTNTAFAGRYYAVGSGSGITGFTNNTVPVFCTAFSDDPMTLAQESSFDTLYAPTATGTRKLTIPSVLAAYGFFVNAGSKVTKSTQTIQLTGKDLFNIYWGTNATKTYTWKFASFEAQVVDKKTVVSNTVDSAFMSSTIAPLSRSDSSGTTAVFKSFFFYANCPPGTTCTTAQINALPAEINNPDTITSAKFTTLWTAGKAAYQYNGAPGLCIGANAATALGAVAYSQRAICDARNLLIEIKVKNKAGTYIGSLDTTATPASAAPTTPPAYDKPWNKVSLVYANGAQTPPIVSYVYMFVRKNYPASQLDIVKKFANFVTSPNSALLKAQSDEKLVFPGSILTGALAWIKSNVTAF